MFFKNNKIPILMYHSISNESNTLSEKLNKFELQLNLLKRLGYETTSLSLLKKNQKKKFIITFDDGYEDVYTNALPILKKYNFKAVCFFVTNFIGKYNEWDINHKNYIKKKIMNKSQINEWINSGHECGIHTNNHINLEIEKMKTIEQDILKSLLFFKKNFNFLPKYFSYPYGKYNLNSLRIIKKFFLFAVTTKRSRYDVKKFYDHLLPRIPINRKDNILKFLLKVLTPYEDLQF